MNKPMTKLTKSGVKKLEAELENLKTVVRPEIAAKIKMARSFGDLSENSEYDEAKNEQGLIESRIAEIEQTLAHAVILDDDEISTEKVGIGNVVTILDIEMEEEMTFQIVGTSELLTIAFVNAFMTSPGNPPIRHIKRPARNSTSLASYFLTISTNVKMTIRPPANNIVKTSVQIYLTFQFFAMYIFYIFSIYLSIIINNFIVHHECTRKGYIL